MKKIFGIFALLSTAWTSFALAQSDSLKYPRLIKRDLVINLVEGKSAEAKLALGLSLQKQLETMAHTKTEKSSKRDLVIFNKKAGMLIDGKLIVNELEGCQVFDEGCQRILRFSNPNIPWENESYEGEVSVPAKSVVLGFSVCARDAEQGQKILQVFNNLDPSLHIVLRTEAIYTDGVENWKDDLSCIPK